MGVGGEMTHAYSGVFGVSPTPHARVYIHVCMGADLRTHLDEDVGDEEHAGVHIDVHGPKARPPLVLGDPAPGS